MAGILGAASIPFIACVSLLVAMVLQILSYASPFWANDEQGDFGLWRYKRCFDSSINLKEECVSYNWGWDVDLWLNVTRGLESLTIIFWAIPLIVLPVYIYVALGLYYRFTLGTMTVLTLLGCGTNIAGVIIFGIELASESKLSVRWCLIVCAVSFAFGLIAFFVLLVSTIFRPKFAPERHGVSGFYVDPYKNKLYVVETTEPIYMKDPSVLGQENPVIVN